MQMTLFAVCLVSGLVEPWALLMLWGFSAGPVNAMPFVTLIAYPGAAACGATRHRPGFRGMPIVANSSRALAGGRLEAAAMGSRRALLRAGHLTCRAVQRQARARLALGWVVQVRDERPNNHVTAGTVASRV